jgi:alpha-L-fucosidase
MKKRKRSNSPSPPRSPQKEEKTKDTKDTKDTKAKDPSVGVIFHWGLYSVPAFDIINPSRHHLNGSEWYYKQLMEKGTYRPISGYKETQEYHRQHFGDQPYDNFANGFTAQNWNVQEWMTLAKSIGVSYAILTAKHHDGFCLWKTKTTKRNSIDTGPHRDLLREFADACTKNGLAFGVYYSWMEFQNPSCTKNYINSIVIPQIKELITYKPDIWWFDGHWPCKSDYASKIAKELIQEIRAKNRNAKINDRIPGMTDELKNPNFLGLATYRNYSDREIPNEAPKVPWESIQTIGYSWGRNRQQKKHHYKSGLQLMFLMKKVAEKNGNFLINLGPNADGTLDPFEIASLTELAKLRAEAVLQVPRLVSE